MWVIGWLWWWFICCESVYKMLERGGVLYELCFSEMGYQWFLKWRLWLLMRVWLVMYRVCSCVYIILVVVLWLLVLWPISVIVVFECFGVSCRLVGYRWWRRGLMVIEEIFCLCWWLFIFGVGVCRVVDVSVWLFVGLWWVFKFCWVWWFWISRWFWDVLVSFEKDRLIEWLMLLGWWCLRWFSGDVVYCGVGCDMCFRIGLIDLLLIWWRRERIWSMLD